MNYEEFKGVVEERFLNFMPEEYQNHKVLIRKVNKVNQSYDSLTLKSEEGNCSPSICMEYLYDDYQSAPRSLHKLLVVAAKEMVEAMGKSPEIPEFDLDLIKDRVIFQLINTRQNKELLENVPNRAFLDLSIIYRMLLKSEDDGMRSIIIKNDLAERNGMSESALYELAIVNAKKLLVPVVKNMDDFLRDAFGDDTWMSQGSQMWIITNKQAINGAASMLYEDKLHELAEHLNSNLFILPSSIHEVIAVPASVTNDLMALARMVVEINREEVSAEERLSDQVYFYDKNLRKVSLATDTVHKTSEEGMTW